MIESATYVGTQKPEEKSVGSMVVITNFLFDVDGDVIMEIHQPDDELEAHMDVDADFVTLESMDIVHAAGELEWCMDVDADIVVLESMDIAQVAGELEWCMDVDADIVVHESMVISQVADELEWCMDVDADIVMHTTEVGSDTYVIMSHLVDLPKDKGDNN
ncbi:uncharacterized protein F5891DRAFT_987120 [Suillus fuscotomentosus]|uniref:Uncharacterized protein n=1 Tax=Suillus fuscotomentosus TaxID=1912939 RepID=A0AAD4DQJ9_9AGAM|nr:uncharacterized protein F5891DRAFT_987120 [Suillus fuscotomentosus]KAG1890425.1 hypothetical protein F5891DRAFT_987120 [Suillus fuscotomentosus]